MRRLAALSALLVVVLLAGCAKPPTADIDAAHAAFDAATAAQADVFAPQAYDSAKTAVAAMDAEVAAQAKKPFKSYAKAKSLAAAARKAADDARAAAETRKTELRGELPRTIGALLDSVRATESKLASALGIRGVRLDGASLRADLQSVRTTIEQARADLGAGRLDSAQTKTTQARDALARINRTIDDARAAATVKKR